MVWRRPNRSEAVPKVSPSMIAPRLWMTAMRPSGNRWSSHAAGTPRRSRGVHWRIFSIARAAPSPHSPPIPMPYNSLSTISTERFGANAQRTDDRVERHVDDERGAPPDPVGPDAAHEHSDRSHQQRHRCQEGHLLLRRAEVGGYVGVDEHDDEVERVHRPPGQCRRQGVALVGGVRACDPCGLPGARTPQLSTYGPVEALRRGHISTIAGKWPVNAGSARTPPRPPRAGGRRPPAGSGPRLR